LTEGSRKSITFLRHGLSTANYEGVVQGLKDYPLHVSGIEQAQLLAIYWANHGRTYDQIITSPLRRAKDTANVIAEKLSVPLVEDPIWVERDFGEGEGLTYVQMQAYLSANSAGWSNHEPIFTNSETESDLLKRATYGVNSLLNNDNEVVLIVSHGGILGAAMRSILGIPLENTDIRPPSFRFDNTGYSELAFYPEISQWQVLVHNIKPHLEINQ
jgi:broad specificity phosphatase PhoE